MRMRFKDQAVVVKAAARGIGFAAASVVARRAAAIANVASIVGVAAIANAAADAQAALCCEIGLTPSYLSQSGAAVMPAEIVARARAAFETNPMRTGSLS